LFNNYIINYGTIFVASACLYVGYEYLSLFVELMRQYGSLLEDYDTNSPLVNDCIFTMMHHVAGDLGSPQTLYIPSILKSFSRIWEQGLQICEDWVDLIGKLASLFINFARLSSRFLA
jgi:timeless protein